MFDIDNAEVEKFVGTDLNIDLLVKSDLRESIPKFIDMTQGIIVNKENGYTRLKNGRYWMKSTIKLGKSRISRVLSSRIKYLKSCLIYMKTKRIFYSILGCAVAWGMQSMRLKDGQRTYHDFNNTAMGWAIPAALSSSLSQRKGRRFVLLVTVPL